MKKTGFLKIAAAILMLMFTLPAAFVIHFIITSYSIHSEQTPVDAVVILTGGRGRVEEGIRLYKTNGTAFIVLLGVSPSVKLQDLFRGKISIHDESGIVLEKSSRNTIENAIYGKKVLAEKGVKKFYLVTSRYHLMRSLLLFKRIFPKDAVIYPYPVEDRNFTSDISRNIISLKLYARETYKYWIYRIFFMITDESDSLSSLPVQN